jgi:hypothetical protein
MSSPSHHPFWNPSIDSFVNPDFIDITGWTVNLQQVKLGITAIGGFTSPSDSTKPANSPGDNVAGVGPYNSDLVSGELPPGVVSPANSLRLYNSGGTNAAYGIVHGPYVISQSAVNLVAGSTVEFWWRALGSTDAYDVYGYLLNIGNGSTINLLNQTGVNTAASTPWAKNVSTIQSGIGGRYRFVFIAGSYDFTGGLAYGASLYITGVRVKAPVVPV